MGTSGGPAGPVAQTEIESIARRIDFSMIKDSTVLVAGSQGMLGNYTSQALLSAARLQDNSPSKFISLGRRELDNRHEWSREFPNFKHVVQEIGFESKFPHSDFFLHFASAASPTKYESASALWATNLGGAVGGLAAIGPSGRSLFLSSGEVYGAGQEGGYKNSSQAKFAPFGERASYPNSKLATEFMLKGWAAETNGDARIARIFHTFGPGFLPDDGRSFADILWAAARGRNINLLSDGAAIRNFAYIEDSIAGLLTLLLASERSVTSDVGGSERISVLDFANLVASIAEVEVNIDVRQASQRKADVAGEPPTPDTRPLQELGWRCETSIGEGIERTLSYLRLQADGKV